LAVAYDSKSTLRIFELTQDTLVKVFEFRHLGNQYPLIPNQLDTLNHPRPKYHDLTHRSVTDLSCNLNGEVKNQLWGGCATGGSMEIHKEQV
jgi:hypothetical protein